MVKLDLGLQRKAWNESIGSLNPRQKKVIKEYYASKRRTGIILGLGGLAGAEALAGGAGALFSPTPGIGKAMVLVPAGAGFAYGIATKERKFTSEELAVIKRFLQGYTRRLDALRKHHSLRKLV